MCKCRSPDIMRINVQRWQRISEYSPHSLWWSGGKQNMWLKQKKLKTLPNNMVLHSTFAVFNSIVSYFKCLDVTASNNAFLWCVLFSENLHCWLGVIIYFIYEKVSGHNLKNKLSWRDWFMNCGDILYCVTNKSCTKS